MRKPNALFASLLLAACGGGSEIGLDQSTIDPIPTCPLGWNCFTVTSAFDFGPGSLRQAITDANARAGRDRILFGLPGAGPHVINTAGFTVTDPIYIDGYSQPGSARATSTAPAQIKVELESVSISNGVMINTDDSVVSGLVLRDFPMPSAAVSLWGDDNVLQGCQLDDNFLGVSIDGERNVVGGLTPGDRNVIGTSQEAGIVAFNCSDCRIIGNHIGTDASGTLDRGNLTGIAVTGDVGMRVGGTELGARNVISGNGVGVELATDDSRVEGNFIGTNASATQGGTALANNTGVLIQFNQEGNVVGGTAAGAGNIISNNVNYGIKILGDLNRVEGNRIGTNAAGTVALGNEVGVGIFGDENFVGGAGSAARNVISGNEYQGVQIASVIGSAPLRNAVQGNFIGVDRSGTLALGNGAEGVLIVDGALNLIGGQAAGTGNTIGGNGGDGIALESGAAVLDQTNVVQGNHIGTDAAGVLSLGNAGSGVRVSAGLEHWIGGPLAGQGNRIARNTLDGVTIESGAGHAVLGNSIWLNGGNSIDLGPNGWTPNDGLGDADAGANDLQNSPVIGTVTRGLGSATIAWSLETTANVQVRVEFFASSACPTVKRGNAQRFIGAATVTTDATGRAGGAPSFSGVAGGEWVTATASEIVSVAGRNSSEVSLCVAVP